MALDRQGTGLTITRMFLGVFFIAEGLTKYRWFFNSSILAGRLQNWLEAAPAGSSSHWYLEHVTLPGVALFARLVPLGELSCGVALLLGFQTSLFAFIAFLLVLNFHFASRAMFQLAFLTNGYGLPVLGSTLGLALGGVRLPWSVRK